MSRGSAAKFHRRRIFRDLAASLEQKKCDSASLPAQSYESLWNDEALGWDVLRYGGTDSTGSTAIVYWSKYPALVIIILKHTAFLYRMRDRQSMLCSLHGKAKTTFRSTKDEATKEQAVSRPLSLLPPSTVTADGPGRRRRANCCGGSCGERGTSKKVRVARVAGGDSNDRPRSQHVGAGI